MVIKMHTTNSMGKNSALGSRKKIILLFQTYSQIKYQMDIPNFSNLNEMPIRLTESIRSVSTYPPYNAIEVQMATCCQWRVSWPIMFMIFEKVRCVRGAPLETVKAGMQWDYTALTPLHLTVMAVGVHYFVVFEWMMVTTWKWIEMTVWKWMRITWLRMTMGMYGDDYSEVEKNENEWEWKIWDEDEHEK